MAAPAGVFPQRPAVTNPMARYYPRCRAVATALMRPGTNNRRRLYAGTLYRRYQLKEPNPIPPAAVSFQSGTNC